MSETKYVLYRMRYLVVRMLLHVYEHFIRAYNKHNMFARMKECHLNVVSVEIRS